MIYLAKKFPNIAFKVRKDVGRIFDCVIIIKDVDY